MVFALPRCGQGQPMVCKAWLWPHVINLGSERLFLSLPWLFSRAGEEGGHTSHPGQQSGNGTRVPKTQHGAPLISPSP